MTSKRIIDIFSRELPDGGASVECKINYGAEKDSVRTAVAKSMQFLNHLCERMDLGIVLMVHDSKTAQILDVTFKE